MILTPSQIPNTVESGSSERRGGDVLVLPFTERTLINRQKIVREKALEEPETWQHEWECNNSEASTQSHLKIPSRGNELVLGSCC